MQKIIEQHDAALKLANLFKNLWQSAERDCDKLVAVLKRIAAYDDTGASERLERTGSYSSFDEPHSVQLAREILAELNKEHDYAILDSGGEVSSTGEGSP